jgi:hypothetical protein
MKRERKGIAESGDCLSGLQTAIFNVADGAANTVTARDNRSDHLPGITLAKTLSSAP